MKIAFIGGRDIHQLGGIENYMFNLSTQLVRKGHQAIVYCESDHNAVEEVEGVKVVYMKGPRSNLICKPWVSLKATIRTLVNEKDVDLIHYNAWPPSLWCWIPRLFGVPSLMEGHGLEWQRSKYSPRQQKVMRFMEKLTARMNQHLIMCSEAQVRYFKEKYGRDAVAMPTAVNLPGEAGPSSGILERLGLAPRKFFLFMGRLVQDKNPDYLIRAFIRARHEGFKLVIAGSNDAMPEYVNSLHELGRGHDNVVFSGAVYGAEKDELLRNAYVFCLPSTIEGLSIVLLEAMSYRLPVIASDIEANKEVLQDDKALWVRPENEKDLMEAIETSISSEAMLDSFVQYNYQLIVGKYTWDKLSDRYIDYVQSVLAGNRHFSV